MTTPDCDPTGGGGLPAIPFGYKRIYGPAQKGDGIWDYSTQKFVKVRKEYPWGTTPKERVIIRRCVVEQPELPAVTTCHCGAPVTEHNAATGHDPVAVKPVNPNVFVCDRCGTKTEDISPLGELGQVICEDCARNGL